MKTPKVTFEDGSPAELPHFVSHKVVAAAPILEYNTHVIQLDLGDGKTATAVVEPGMFDRYVPVLGDMYVLYANADETFYASVSPRGVFDAGYSPTDQPLTAPITMTAAAVSSESTSAEPEPESNTTDESASAEPEPAPVDVAHEPGEASFGEPTGIDNPAPIDSVTGG